MERLRPMVERILEPETPEASRPELLELLAETCEREVQNKRSTEAMRVAFRDFFAHIQALLYENYRLRGGTEPFPGGPENSDVDPDKA